MKAKKLVISTKLYYPSLDGLRFLAFLVVFCHHFFFNQSSSNLIINTFFIIVSKNGWVGVDLFFVLSGFLITTLLLEERKKFGSFSLKNFWMRRMLRIWPLYYLALLMGFLVIPYLFQIFLNSNYSDIKYAYQLQTQPIFYLLFLGNWSVFFNGYSAFSNIGHLWTISLEEQFYFLWPLVLLFIRNFRSAILVGLLTVIGSIVSRIYLISITTQHPGIYVNTFARIDILVIGGILALCLFYKPKIIDKINRFINTPLLFLAFFGLLLLLYRISVFDLTIPRNIIFGYLIITFFMVYFVLSALKDNTKFANFLKFPLFVRLGKISFGLYVWHILGIELSSFLTAKIGLRPVHFYVSLGMTILLAYISYTFYESYFLKLKDKFSKIQSRPI